MSFRVEQSLYDRLEKMFESSRDRDFSDFLRNLLEDCIEAKDHKFFQQRVAESEDNQYNTVSKDESG